MGSDADVSNSRDRNTYKDLCINRDTRVGREIDVKQPTKRVTNVWNALAGLLEGTEVASVARLQQAPMGVSEEEGNTSVTFEEHGSIGRKKSGKLGGAVGRSDRIKASEK